MLDDEYWSQFSSDPEAYTLGNPIGFGASSIVYAAAFSSAALAAGSSTPTSSRPDLHGTGSTAGLHGQVEITCAVKVSSASPDIDQLFMEARLLSLCRHPNVLRILATFTLPPDHARVALVTPLIAGGSLAGILDWRSRFSGTPEHHRGFRLHLGKKREDSEQAKGTLGEEEIKAVVKQVLEGLVYLHEQGYIHRDIKAGNLLVDCDGTILLADFGVGGDVNVPLVGPDKELPAADTIRFDRKLSVPLALASRDRRMSAKKEEIGRRKSFVGTPSWMAPEVILGQKYDSKADIWSLGITILELAHGAAPGAKDESSKILRNAVMEPAPSLDRSFGSFSRAMKEFVDMCLVKDPGSRSAAAQLVDHPWLRGSKKKDFIAQSLLANVPPIETRQEIRRVSSVASLASRTSSWDFAPSVAATPIRSSFIVPLRSPSVLSGVGEYSHNMPSRSHSQSSFRIPSLPPSPRVPLKQWAERTASLGPDDETVWARTTSEKGQRQRQSSVIRRGRNASFDHGQIPQSDGSSALQKANKMPSVEMGTVEERETRNTTLSEKEYDGSPKTSLGNIASRVLSESPETPTVDSSDASDWPIAPIPGGESPRSSASVDGRLTPTARDPIGGALGVDTGQRPTLTTDTNGKTGHDHRRWLGRKKEGDQIKKESGLSSLLSRRLSARKSKG